MNTIFDRPIVELNELMLSFWQIAGIIILFSAGLHFTFSSLKQAGIQAIIIGTAGVIVPLLLGYGISILLEIDWMVPMIIGATLSATSIAAAVTILNELEKEETQEGNILVNAAVLDDVLGLAILSWVTKIQNILEEQPIKSMILKSQTILYPKTEANVQLQLK